MCNRVVQYNVEVKPDRKAMVLLKGPGGEFELPFKDAVLLFCREFKWCQGRQISIQELLAVPGVGRAICED